MKFFVIFSQILSTFNQFVGQYDDIHVINLSMGYNWRPNFGVNPDLPDYDPPTVHSSSSKDSC